MIRLFTKEILSMPQVDTQQVCKNGHQITDSVHRHPHDSRKFCPECGAMTIIACPECDAPIPGHTYYEGVYAAYSEPIPSHCASCGKPFPWTVKSVGEVAAVNDASGFDPLILVRKVCSRFHLVAKQIRDRYSNRETLDVGDEYDVQDLLHSLLRIFFDDIRPEEWTPSYAGKCSRMDFLLKEHQLVIETKMTRKGLGAKEVGTQLIEDIARYGKHPECETLVCFVYDPDGRVSNPSGLETDLSGGHNGLAVKVLIVPKGY